ncbi:hypothetical protein Goari_005063 [Gossypium aridum]|uniref:Uncharacterized protein n=1 Tax=Gossypium aridum TaxID=34290 RepID=A0A7J8Y5D2_GOSAI|nr:hypothetical protein [Gossypium aridum]
MTKRVNKQNVTMETRARKNRKNNRSRDMLLDFESRVIHIDKSMGEVEETLEVVEGHIDELDQMKKQFKEYMTEALNSNMDALQALFNTIVGKLAKKNDALEAGMIAIKEENKAIMMTLNTKIEELKVELLVCKMVVGKWEIEQYFHTMGMKDDDSKVKQDLEHQRVQELLKAMIVVKSLIKLVLRKDNFESSKPKDKGNGEGDEEGKIENSNDNGGKVKPHNGKQKPNNKSKKSVKFFLYGNLHMVRHCRKQPVFFYIKMDDELDKTSMSLGSLSFAKVNRVRENKKKPMACFLTCGRHKMCDCPERSKISMISKEVEGKPESENLKLGSMILNSGRVKRDHR